MKHIMGNSWLGITFGANSNQYPPNEPQFWDDGTPISYTNWRDGNPQNDADKLCAQIKGDGLDDGLWKNCPCELLDGKGLKKYPICIRPAVTLSTTKPPSTIPTASPHEECDYGWHFMSSSQKCVLLMPDEKPWKTSLGVCEGEGGTLVSINSPAEQDQLFEVASLDPSASVLILNQWVASNPAISFSWGENDVEDYSRVSNFEFHPTYKLKLSCSGVIGEKMFIVGAEGIAGGMPEVVYQVDDCGVKETEIKLPWYMSAHSCTVVDDVMHICGSQMDLHTKDCVTFDGTSFGKKTSTRNDHSWGAMAEFNRQPVVLGGLLYQAGDTSTVETFNGSRWSALPSMPTEKRVFDAIGLGDRLCTFGGYVASSGQATDEITCFDGTSWSNVGNLFTPRYGARVIQYGEAGLLLIGGTAGGTNSVLPFEKIDEHTFESKISKNTLVSYVDWPETFVVPANFCA